MDLKNVQLVAHFEKKVLLRNSVFRTISILGLIIIFILQLLLQGKNGNYWFLIALPSSIPFVNTLLFTFLQIFLVIVATSEWKRQAGKHYDTLDSLRTRPISNTEMLTGKIYGIITAILIINIISIVLALLVHTLNSDSPFRFYPYIFYFLTLSIPSLIFLTGTAFLVFGLVKQQGLSILLLCFLFIGSTAFLPEMLHGLLDFRATILPNVFSDITGHVKLLPYLMHRMLFLFLGVAGIIYSIGIEKRLPNHTRTPVRTYIFGTGGILLTILFGIGYCLPFREDGQLRLDYRNSALKYHQNTHAQIEEHEITFTQDADQIIAKSLLKITNSTGHPLDRIVFYLNPGLKVTSVKNSMEQSLEYSRENQILEVYHPLSAGNTITLSITYKGRIDEKVCYLDIDLQDHWNDQFMNCPLHFGKRYAYSTPSFTLLTPECYWYPVTAPIVNLTSPYSSAKDFTHFLLKVIPGKQQTVISQGKIQQAGDTVLFHNTHELQGISLCMGDYEKRSILVDSVLMELYTFEGHFHFLKYFEELTEDDLRDYLRACKAYMESLDRPYPFNKFALVETPVSFADNYRPYMNNSGFTQPEILFFPERWVTHPQAFHPKQWKNIEATQKRNASVGYKMTIQEIYLHDLFIVSTFKRSFLSFTPRNIFLPSFLQQDKKYMKNPYEIRSMFSDFSNYWYSEEYPIINNIMYQFDAFPNIQKTSIDNISTYKATQYLSFQSFRDAINDTDLGAKTFQEIFKLKAMHLIYIISLKITTQEFHQFADDYKAKHRFQKLSFDAFLLELKEHFDIDLILRLPNWYNSAGLPTFRIKDFETFEITGEDFPQYQMRAKIYNNSDIDGIISTSSNPNDPRCYSIPAKTCWEINEIYTNAFDMKLNLGFTSNIPSTFYNITSTYTNHIHQKDHLGIFPCDPKEFSPVPGEVIVDNEDDGFKLYSPSDKRWLSFSDKTEKEYIFETFTQYSYGRILPSRWTTYISHDFYGETIRGAVCKLAGKGGYHAEWTTELTESGKYEIFIYESPAQIHLNKRELEQNYTITTRDGEQQVVLKKVWNSDGWISLGEFYLNAGTNKITLSDKGSHPEQMIVADAVKWKFVKNKAYEETKR